MRTWLIAGAALLATALLVTLGLVRPAPAHPAAAALAATSGRTILSVVAHPDDDLLFLNPDILSDIRAGSTVWTVFLTDGRANGDPAQHDADFVDARIRGVRAAYAAMAGVPDRWTFVPLVFNGHEVATNHLEGTRVHLAFLFVRGAANCCLRGDPFGDLFRLLQDPAHVARPSDGRAPYTRDSLVGTLRALTDAVNPDQIRSLYSLGHRDTGLALDHCDHTAAAILTGLSDSDARSRTLRTRREYWGYRVRTQPDNQARMWQGPKFSAWQAYVAHDPGLPGPQAWNYGLLARSYAPADRVFPPGSLWTPPADFGTCPDRAGNPVSWASWNLEFGKEGRHDPKR
nr:hypothetical protein [Propionibacterium sp.]